MSDCVTGLNDLAPPADFNKYFAETKHKLTFTKKNSILLAKPKVAIILLGKANDS